MLTRNFENITLVNKQIKILLETSDYMDYERIGRRSLEYDAYVACPAALVFRLGDVHMLQERSARKSLLLGVYGTSMHKRAPTTKEVAAAWVT
jgi:hypothetical protein